MSTKKKLIEATKRISLSVPYTTKSRQVVKNVMEVVDDIAKLQAELYLKENIPITKELLEKNGFEVLAPRVALPFNTWSIIDNKNFWFDEYKEDRNYLDDGTFGLVKKGTYLIRFSSTLTELKTVADLEDALDLCGIDKEIEIL